jgi:hypothetical protein
VFFDAVLEQLVVVDVVVVALKKMILDALWYNRSLVLLLLLL